MQENTSSTPSSTATAAEQISREYGTVVARSEVSTPVVAVPLRPKNMQPLHLLDFLFYSHSLGIPPSQYNQHPSIFPSYEFFFSNNEIINDSRDHEYQPGGVFF